MAQRDTCVYASKKVDVLIKNDKTGEIVFQKDGFEVPEAWSRTAATICADKYATDAECSAFAIIDRVVDQITKWGIDQGYFDSAQNEEDGDIDEVVAQACAFKTALKDILVNQKAAFNSPTWMNIGVPDARPRVSACFITPIEDTMESILNNYVVEGKIFMDGSGSGSNISDLRAKGEMLSNKGCSSGPISFLQGFDRSAGSVKSGGRTRRSAKMICMDMDHPDIEEFIACKTEEEEKIRVLMDAGYSYDDAKDTVAYQNTNHSVRITDAFMLAVENGDSWDLINRGDGAIAKTVDAKELLELVAFHAHKTGDPGVQFHDRINLDNPVPSLGEIRGSNPCSEFHFVNNSSCNLASMNLTKYLDTDTNDFNQNAFFEDIQIIIKAMDIMIDPAHYPNEGVGRVTRDTRALGLGFSGLGGLLMRKGLAYHSEEARTLASRITMEMTEAAYHASLTLAKDHGSFAAFDGASEIAMLDIMERTLAGSALLNTFKEVLASTGIRNSQLTLLAPTGTIGLMMDCDSFGVEPLFALTSYKSLVGGGMLEMTPDCVRAGLAWVRNNIPEVADYSDEEVFKCVGIFDTANDLSGHSHIKMMEACQAHLHSGISKSVNLHKDASVDEVYDIYWEAHHLGLKAVALFRDQCKAYQPMTAKKTPEESSDAPIVQPDQSPIEAPRTRRERLLDDRDSKTHKFSITGHEGYITVGMYPDGSPGEMFIKMQKEGSNISGMMDAFAISISLMLQYGVPLRHMVDKFKGSKFEPQGITQNPDIVFADSIIDYIFKWVEKTFMNTPEDIEAQEEIIKAIKSSPPSALGGLCPICGGVTVTAGTCNYCLACGGSSGCS